MLRARDLSWLYILVIHVMNTYTHIKSNQRTAGFTPVTLSGWALVNQATFRTHCMQLYTTQASGDLLITIITDAGIMIMYIIYGQLCCFTMLYK